MAIARIASATLLLAAWTVAGAEPTGTIRICRAPSIVGLMDGKQAPIPAGSRFAGACDQNHERCRNITVVTTAPATVGPKRQDCATVAATLQQGDGAPVHAGERLLASWEIPGFEPRIVVQKAFAERP